MKKLFIAIPIVFMICLGCATAPTQQEIDKADYGEYPSDYQAIIMTYLQNDPYSLMDLRMSKPRKCWTEFKEGFVYGYLVYVSYNAKNRYGGYTGQKEEFAFIRKNRVEMMVSYSIALRFYHVVENVP